MPEVAFPVLEIKMSNPEPAAGQVKAFLVSCTVTGQERLVGRDEVRVRVGQLVYHCPACRCAHPLHIWPKGGTNG